jgi:hypothetical protein
MEQSPSWEAKSSSATQEIPCILWIPKAHYRIHNSPPPVSILNQIDPVYVPPSNLSKIYFNIIFPSTLGSSKQSSCVRFPPPKPWTHLSSPPYVLHTLATAVSLISSPEEYLVKTADWHRWRKKMDWKVRIRRITFMWSGKFRKWRPEQQQNGARQGCNLRVCPPK